MFVICMNDHPVATTATEDIANEAKKYIQGLWNILDKVQEAHSGPVHIHVHEVPTVINTPEFHRVFLTNSGSQYQYILNMLRYSLSAIAKTPEYFVLNNVEAVALFQKFKETYPAIDNFIKMYSERLEPPTKLPSEIDQVQKFASDLSNYDSVEFAPPESVSRILNDSNVQVWLDDMLKHCVSLAVAKYTELRAEDNA